MAILFAKIMKYFCSDNQMVSSLSPHVLWCPHTLVPPWTISTSKNQYFNIQKTISQDHLSSESPDSALAMWLMLSLTGQCLYFTKYPTLDHSSAYIISKISLKCRHQGRKRMARQQNFQTKSTLRIKHCWMHYRISYTE